MDGFMPSYDNLTEGFYDCRCHTWYQDPSISSNTGSSSRSTASHQAAEWDNWTEIDSSPGTPDSHTFTIATHATCYSDGPLPDDGAAELMTFIIEKIFASWTRLRIASSLTTTLGFRILTQSRSHLQTQNFMGSAAQSIHQCKQ